jgi:hypothetical protein
MNVSQQSSSVKVANSRNIVPLEMSSILSTKFWESFQKYAFMPHDTTKYKSLSLHVNSLATALKSMSSRVTDAEVANVVIELGLSPVESLSWVEYKNVCAYVFSPQMFYPTTEPKTSALSPTRHGMSQQHSPTRHGMSQHSMPRSMSNNGLSQHGLTRQMSNSQTEPDLMKSVKSQSFEVLLRKHRTTSTMANEADSAGISEEAMSRVDMPAMKKDTLCDVLKQNYRDIRKNKKQRMYICMYVRMYVFMYVCMYVCMLLSTYVCMYMYGVGGCSMVTAPAPSAVLCCVLCFPVLCYAVVIVTHAMVL